MQKQDTVTISLEKYEGMLHQIKILEQEVWEKTIVRYYFHPTAILIGLIIGVVGSFFLSIFGR